MYAQKLFIIVAVDRKWKEGDPCTDRGGNTRWKRLGSNGGSPAAHVTVGFTWLSPADEAASAPLDVGEVLDSKKCERNQADARDAWNMVGWKGQRRMRKKQPFAILCQNRARSSGGTSERRAIVLQQVYTPLSPQTPVYPSPDTDFVPPPVITRPHSHTLTRACHWKP